MRKVFFLRKENCIYGSTNISGLIALLCYYYYYSFNSLIARFTPQWLFPLTLKFAKCRHQPTGYYFIRKNNVFLPRQKSNRFMVTLWRLTQKFQGKINDTTPVTLIYKLFFTIDVWKMFTCELMRANNNRGNG